MFWMAIALMAVAYYFFRSPIPQAVAESFRRHSGGSDPRADQALSRITEEMNALREQLNELAERVDFAERALAEVRRREALQPPRS